MSTLLSRLLQPKKKTPKQFEIKIASYDSMMTLPRIELIQSTDIADLIKKTSETTYRMVKEKGGSIPFMVINEIIENLIHANFQDATVTILPGGNTINVSDQGPGIPDKTKAVLPGFSTSNHDVRQYIRGVGSGLPIAKESIEHMGGTLIIDDNLRKGSVISITLESKGLNKQTSKNSHPEKDNEKEITNNSRAHAQNNEISEIQQQSANKFEDESFEQDDYSIPDVTSLSERQKKILLLLGDADSLGPSSVATELNISLSTAYRDMVALEEYGLVECLEGGKRRLTIQGISFLSRIFR